MGILQARILGWVAISSSRGSSQPGIEFTSPARAADCLKTPWLRLTLSGEQAEITVKADDRWPEGLLLQAVNETMGKDP